MFVRFPTSLTNDPSTEGRDKGLRAITEAEDLFGQMGATAW